MDKKNNKILELKVFAIWIFAIFFSISFLFIFGNNSVESASPPTVITYQGKLLKSGASVTTTQDMAFVIYDASTGGNLLYTASGTTAVTTTLEVEVNSGIFAVDLGDTGTNSFESGMFANTTTLYLEIIIEEDGSPVALTPRKQLTSVPFAYNSTYLLGKTAAITSTESYIPFASSTGMFEFAGTPQSAAVGAGSVYINPIAADADETLFGIALNGSERFRVDEDGDTGVYGNLTVSTTVYTDVDNGYVGINSSTPGFALSVNGEAYITGTTTITDALYVNGKAINPIHAGALLDGVGGAELTLARDIIIQNDLAYVLTSSTLEVVNISDPTNPVHVGKIEDGDQGIEIRNAGSMAMFGNYAVLFSRNSGAPVVPLIDISDPTNLKFIVGIPNGQLMETTAISHIHQSGGFIYAPSFENASIEIIPFNSIINNSVRDTAERYFTGVDADIVDVQDVFVQGNYLYAYTSNFRNNLVIYDVSDPKNIYQVGMLNGVDSGEGSPSFDERAVTVSGNYAYIASGDLDNFQIVDVSDPSSPSVAGTLSNGGSVKLDNPQSIALSGNYAFVASYESDAIEVINIASSTNPTHVTSISNGDGGVLLNGPQVVLVDGNYLYVASENSGALEIIDITGSVISNAEIGSVKVDNLRVTNPAYFENSIYANNGLTVGADGLFVLGDVSFGTATSTMTATNTLRFSHRALFRTSVSSTDSYAFIFDTDNALTSATSSYLFSVRNNKTPVFSISANGDVQTTGQYYGSAVNVGSPGAPGDLAERVDILPGEIVTPGDVLVVDILDKDRYRKSTSAYERAVAGVVSTKPTITVGNGKTTHTADMAMVGRVPLKVINENGDIHAGDLLVTASKAGYAMKYDSTQDDGSRVVAIVGVALENFSEESGKIMTLIRSGWINSRHASITEIQQDLVTIAESEGVVFEKDSSQVTIELNEEGNLVDIDSDLDMKGYYIYNVAGLFGVENKWSIDAEGRFITKVDTDEGEKELYALQSENTEYVFSGTGQLEDGEIKINFDAITQEIIDQTGQIKVSVTLTDEANGVYITQKDGTGFVVRELSGGQSSATFDWLVIANRSVGHDDEEAEEVDDISDNEEDDVSEPEEIIDEEVSNNSSDETDVLDEQTVVEDNSIEEQESNEEVDLEEEEVLSDDPEEQLVEDDIVPPVIPDVVEEVVVELDIPEVEPVQEPIEEEPIVQIESEIQPEILIIDEVDPPENDPIIIDEEGV
jgi:hypothetical protein